MPFNIFLRPSLLKRVAEHKKWYCRAMEKAVPLRQ